MTRFGNGLVMGSADCINHAGLIKTLEKLFKRKSGLCQSHCRLVPLFSPLSEYQVITWFKSANQFIPYTRIMPPVPTYGSIWVVLWLSCFRSAPSTFPQKTGHILWGHFWESLVFRLHSIIGQIHLSIEAQCDHHNIFSTESIVVQL